MRTVCELLNEAAPEPPSEPIPVYFWMCGTDKLYRTYLDKVHTPSGRVFFKNGWGDMQSTFLSIEQAMLNPDREFAVRQAISFEEVAGVFRQAALEGQRLIKQIMSEAQP